MYTADSIVRLGDRIWKKPVEVLRSAGLTPMHITLASLAICLIAAAEFYLKEFFIAYGLLTIGMVLDGLDGAMARRFNLASEKGEMADTIADRISEAAIIIALGLNNTAEIKLSLLAIYAILLNTIIRKKARFDLGFKRIVIYFAPLISFNNVMRIIFLMNILSFLIQLMIIDYRRSRKEICKRISS